MSEDKLFSQPDKLQERFTWKSLLNISVVNENTYLILKIVTTARRKIRSSNWKQHIKENWRGSKKLSYFLQTAWWRHCVWVSLSFSLKKRHNLNHSPEKKQSSLIIMQHKYYQGISMMPQLSTFELRIC